MRTEIMTRSTTLLLSVALALAAVPALAQPGEGGPHGGPHGGRMLERFDSDKDGAISPQEFATARAANFARLDADGDGRIARQDFPDAVARAREERAERMFEELDADKDGVLTKAEFEAHSSRAFARMDRNGDGKLSPEDRGRR